MSFKKIIKYLNEQNKQKPLLFFVLLTLPSLLSECSTQAKIDDMNSKIDDMKSMVNDMNSKIDKGSNTIMILKDNKVIIKPSCQDVLK